MDEKAYQERNASQKPAIELLQTMGYIYISPADCQKQRGSRYHVLLKDILRGQLRRLNRYSYAGTENEFSAANIERAMEDLDEPLTDGLVRTSEKIYDALLLGKSYPESPIPKPISKHCTISSPLPYELFVDLVLYHLNGEDDFDEEIRQGLEQKLDAMLNRQLYSEYKTAPTEEQREQARQEYLDRRGVPQSYRWITSPWEL